MKQLTSIHEVNQFAEQPGKQVLFKHNTTCPISAKAYEELQAFIQKTNVPAAIVLVLEDRPVSEYITEQFGIKHESPQVFLFEGGHVRWHESLSNITEKALKEAAGK